MSDAGFSVVVPTKGRAPLVRRLLASLRADAATAGFAVEVLLVDDSGPRDRPAIDEAAREHGARRIDGPPHVGAKRNLGVRSAGHARILFLDSDVVVRPGLLAAHARALEDGPAGCLGLVVFTGRPTLAYQAVAQMQLMLPFSYPLIADRVPWGPTANLSVARRAFESVGGFDPTLPPYGGEDVDLGLRLTDAGHRIATSRHAVVEHSIETWSRSGENLSRLLAYGRADAHLILRHPRRAYFDPISGLPVLGAQAAASLAGLAFLRGRRRAGVLGAALGSAAAYHLLFAAVKHRRGRSFAADLFGPTVLAALDLGRLVEAVRLGRPALFWRRLRFIEDQAAHDRPESAANAAGFAASVLALAAGTRAALERR